MHVYRKKNRSFVRLWLSACALLLVLALFVRPVSVSAAENLHVWGPWSILTQPTCTQSGYEQRVCIHCGLQQRRSVPPLGHDFKVTVVKPTCTKPGETIYVCKRCGYTYTKKGAAALGHQWGSWVVVKKATDRHEGLEERTCSRCGLKQERATPKLPLTLLDQLIEPHPVGVVDVVMDSAGIGFFFLLVLLTLTDIRVFIWLRNKQRIFLKRQRELCKGGWGI